jgi:hypothetical protein
MIANNETTTGGAGRGRKQRLELAIMNNAHHRGRLGFVPAKLLWFGFVPPKWKNYLRLHML